MKTIVLFGFLVSVAVLITETTCQTGIVLRICSSVLRPWGIVKEVDALLIDLCDLLEGGANCTVLEQTVNNTRLPVTPLVKVLLNGACKIIL
ncbi:UNVERIFIED_CONTAM: hypothetical protein RMT77_001143 [Armadillidium vulgare]